MKNNFLKKILISLLLLGSIPFLSGCEEYIGYLFGKQDEATLQASQQKKFIADQKRAQAEAQANQKPAENNTANPVENGKVMMYQEQPAGEPVEIFRVGNDLAVYNGGTSPTVDFPIGYYVTEITTYHWNESKGTPPGTIAIKGGDGTMYGPWQATLVNGVYWRANPNVTLKAGSYTIVDSDPSTWAQNPEDGGKGMTWALGIPVK